MLDWSKPGQKYAEMADAFCAKMGRKPGSHPVINRKDHPNEYRDWYAYYGWRKLLASQDMMRQREEKVVPSLSPFDFDAEFNPSKPSPEVPRESETKDLPPMTDQRRALHLLKFPQFRQPMPDKDSAA